MSITINNPTQLSFTHDKFQAENVTIIPTPNNSSDLATMIKDTTYYDISNDSECRYKKVITPRPNVAGVNTNCIKGEDNNPVSAKVCHYTINNEDHYVVDKDVNLVNFNNDNVMFQNSTISDDEISFKDSKNNQIKLDVVNSTSGIELENRPTMTSFSFNVPSFVSKVEIEHKMDASLQGASDKAKIHIDLKNDNETYYIAEKRSNTTDGQTSVTVFTNIYGKELRNVMSTAGEHEEFLKVDLGNGFVYFCNQSGGDIYRAYWDNTVGETEHIYSFTKNDGSGYTIKSFKESLGDNYGFLMKLSELEEKISNISYKDEPTLEETQDTSLDFMTGSIKVGSGYYAEDKISNYPGLYTLYNDFEKYNNAGYFFLEGTNHIFKINILSDNERIKTPHTLNETDIKNGLEVFTGGTFTENGVVIDDTYTSQLNFGTLCDELAKGITSSNILNSSSTESSTNN